MNPIFFCKSKSLQEILVWSLYIITWSSPEFVKSYLPSVLGYRFLKFNHSRNIISSFTPKVISFTTCQKINELWSLQTYWNLSKMHISILCLYEIWKMDSIYIWGKKLFKKRVKNFSNRPFLLSVYIFSVRMVNEWEWKIIIMTLWSTLNY